MGIRPIHTNVQYYAISKSQINVFRGVKDTREAMKASSTTVMLFLVNTFVTPNNLVITRYLNT